MSDRPLQSLIGENHRRVLSVRMRLLEEYSSRLLELFQPVESLLTSRPPLPQGMKERMEGEVAELHSRIHRIKADLGLEQSRRSARREAAALVTTMITYVEELHPRYLKGYGSIPEPVGSYLKECLTGFLEALDKINQTLKERL
jgi:hypothetical protein